LIDMAATKTAAPAGSSAANKKMAKAAKKEQNSAGKKGKVGLIIILVLVVLILAGAAMMAFNVFGIRDNTVVPMLRNVPLVGGLLPEAEVDPYAAEAERYDFEATIAALQATIADLEAEIEHITAMEIEVEEQLAGLFGTMAEHYLEMERLREIERLHLQIEANRAQFEREVAEENPDAFINFFETMHPDTMEEIVRQLMSVRARDERWEGYVATWTAMNPRNVAWAIEEMASTNMQLIVEVMPYIPENSRAAILNQLSTETASAILRQMRP